MASFFEVVIQLITQVVRPDSVVYAIVEPPGRGEAARQRRLANTTQTHNGDADGLAGVYGVFHAYL
jgi:hypothetical protein